MTPHGSSTAVPCQCHSRLVVVPCEQSHDTFHVPTAGFTQTLQVMKVAMKLAWRHGSRFHGLYEITYIYRYILLGSVMEVPWRPMKAEGGA